MWFGLARTEFGFAGLPIARTGWRMPASAAGWMRAQAYRTGSRTPQGAAQWRAQFNALAQQSWQKYRQTVPGAAKLANPAAMQSILRDLQNARVSLNDLQVRAKAAELRVITDYLRRPDVTSVRVVPSSSAGRTPDLYVTYRGRRPPERIEVRTLTGNRVGWRPTSRVPIARAPEVQRLTRAISDKVQHGQLRAAVPGLRTGGTLVLRLTAPPKQAEAMARQVMANLARKLAGATELERVEFLSGGKLITFTRRGSRYVGHAVDRVPLGQERAQAREAARARASARRAAARRRRR